MTNITLSIEDSIYNKMKKHSEIKWSEFVRKCIEARIEKLQEIGDDVAALADEKLLSQDWLSDEDNMAWKDL